MLQKPLIKKRNLTREKKREALHTRIFIFFLIAYLIYYVFDKRLIGHDWRYTVFIFWVPILTGLAILAYYFRKTIFPYIVSEKKIIPRILIALLFLGQGVVFSFTSLGMITDIIWKYVDSKVAESHDPEYFNCAITGFRSYKKWNKIYFIFQERASSIEIDYETIRLYENENPKKYILKLSARKGLWDLYTIEDWDVKYAGD